MQQEIQKSLSCRKVSVRHLPIIVSDGTVNERKSSGRYPTKTFGYDKHFYMNGNNGFTPALVIPTLRAAKAGYSAGRKDGFTLIELLVVVLIIGILAAVAVPQYQKAVEKSRATQALTLLKSIGQAYEAHHLASGEWAQKFDELDVDFTGWTGTTKFLNYSGEAISDTKSNNDWSLQIENAGIGGSSSQDIRMHRLTGKYKGAGFVIYFDNSSHTAAKKIVCNERITSCNSDYCFTGNAGDYCEKIMRGTLYSTASTSRSYSLP